MSHLPVAHIKDSNLHPGSLGLAISDDPGPVVHVVLEVGDDSPAVGNEIGLDDLNVFGQARVTDAVVVLVFSSPFAIPGNLLVEDGTVV